MQVRLWALKIFLFWVQEMVQFWKNGIIFERKLVNFIKNSQKLFLQTATAQRARNPLLRCTTSDSKENCPLLEGNCMATKSCPLFERHRGALNGNGKLPLVWMAPQRIVGSPQSDEHNQTLGYRESEDDQNHRMDTIELFYGWTSEWSCLRIPKMGIKPYVVRG